MKSFLLHLATTLLVVTVCFAAYDRVVVRPNLVIGVVDVGEVYRAKEAEFTQILTRAGTDAERDRALALARSFAQRLPLALEELPRECRCLVMLRSAVAGSTDRMVDLTPELQAKVTTP